MEEVLSGCGPINWVGDDAGARVLDREIVTLLLVG